MDPFCSKRFVVRLLRCFIDRSAVACDVFAELLLPGVEARPRRAAVLLELDRDENLPLGWNSKRVNELLNKHACHGGHNVAAGLVLVLLDLDTVNWPTSIL